MVSRAALPPRRLYGYVTFFNGPAGRNTQLEHLVISPSRVIARAGLLVVALSAGLAGCNIAGSALDGSSLRPSSSPVTVDTMKRSSRLAQLAEAQHPTILRTYGGEYSDPKLERMVAKVVGRLTTVSSNPDEIYRITLLNSPNVNAFALPGGYLYITRGLLALANDSAELATVVSHEMAHVTANHGILRQQREKEEGLATRVADDLLTDNVEARAAIMRGRLRLAQFSRNQELEADAIGIKAAGDAGFDPYAAARFLRSMSVYSGFRSVSGADDPSLDFLATHPTGDRRIELALRHARNYGGPGIGITDRDSYLDGLDGILFGDTPEEGFVRGRDFLHPRLGIRFTVPEGFVLDNSAEAVTAAGPGDVAIRFDGVTVDKSVDVGRYIASGWVSGLDKATIRTATVNGLETGMARARADGWQFDITVFRIGSQIYRLLTAAPQSSSALEPTANLVRSSFRTLSADEKSGLKPLRVRIVKVEPGQTVATMAAMMSGTQRTLDLFLLLNGIAPGTGVSAGDRVKIITDR